MKKYFLLSIFWFVSISGFAQGFEKEIQQADSIVTEFFGKHLLPGMSISVYKDDRMIWSKGYGFADLDNEIEVDPSKTLFRIGSVSKTLTAAGLGLIIQDGVLSADDEIQKWVPDFPQKKYPITVKQVSGHIAGIRHYRGDEFMSTKKYETVMEGLVFFKDDSLLFEPGTKYQYSSYGWNLISAVIEGASEEAFLPYMKTHVFEPLGMNNTVPDWADKEIENRTKFYIWRNGTNVEAPYVDNSYKWAGGGFIGTTEDLINFGAAHFDYDFLNEETQEVLITPLETSDGKSTNYGMGYSTLQKFGLKWIGHSGGSVGGSTMFLMNKEHRIVIAYTINRSGASFENLHFRIADIFLNSSE
jgi:serine beta-lactamase-like protein LACTB|tara:strand:- start:151447 stop:152520 length:1074 start_codon:yes stop_codon:yes gene_type:complete